jgi:hypothetical protein
VELTLQQSIVIIVYKKKSDIQAHYNTHRRVSSLFENKTVTSHIEIITIIAQRYLKSRLTEQSLISFSSLQNYQLLRPISEIR